jgi:hypothetical protein
MDMDRPRGRANLPLSRIRAAHPESCIPPPEKNNTMTSRHDSIIIDIATSASTTILQAAEASPGEGLAQARSAVACMVKALRQIDAQVENDAAEARHLREIFREYGLEVCRRSPLIWRGLTKPNGYAGDFFLLDAIYRDCPATDDPAGRLLDTLFLESPLAETVRQRKDTLVESLVQAARESENKPLRLLDLACGPCTDVREALARVEDGVLSFVCVDFDQKALDFAQESFRGGGSNSAARMYCVCRTKFSGSAGASPSQVRQRGMLDGKDSTWCTAWGCSITSTTAWPFTASADGGSLSDPAVV